MNPLFLTLLSSIGNKIIDQVVKNPDDNQKAKTDLVMASQNGEFDDLKTKLSVIVSDSQSADPWTSRARPMFLYVVYFLVLWSIPMGVLAMVRPMAAIAFIAGFNAWLSAIPEPVLNLFALVMTGYTVGRSWEKIKGVSK